MASRKKASATGETRGDGVTVATFSVSLPKGLKQRLDDMAKRNRRSRSAEVQRAVEMLLKAEDS